MFPHISTCPLTFVSLTPDQAAMGGGVRQVAVILLHITAVLTLASLLTGVLTLVVGIIAGATDPRPIVVRTYPPSVLTEKQIQQLQLSIP